MISGKAKEDYFSRSIWTKVIGLIAQTKSVFRRNDFAAGIAD
jgi:hypothetical protein